MFYSKSELVWVSTNFTSRKKVKTLSVKQLLVFPVYFLRGNQHSGALFLCRFNLFLKCISAAAHVEISFKYVWYYNLLYEQIKLLSNNIYYLTQKKLKHVQCVLIVKTSTISLATWHFKYHVQKLQLFIANIWKRYNQVHSGCYRCPLYTNQNTIYYWGER